MNKLPRIEDGTGELHQTNQLTDDKSGSSAWEEQLKPGSDFKSINYEKSPFFQFDSIIYSSLSNFKEGIILFNFLISI